MYGEPLRMPGEFFHSKPDTHTPPADFIQELRTNMSYFKPTPASRYGTKRTFVHKDLKNSDYVFLRKDTLRKPLQAFYIGSH